MLLTALPRRARLLYWQDKNIPGLSLLPPLIWSTFILNYMYLKCAFVFVVFLLVFDTKICKQCSRLEKVPFSSLECPQISNSVINFCHKMGFFSFQNIPEKLGPSRFSGFGREKMRI